MIMQANDNPPNPIPYKMVAFSEITVIEFPIILGDNPACTSGAPIQLDWTPVRTETQDLDMFEYMIRREQAQDGEGDSSSTPTPTTPKESLKWSVPKRAQLLMDKGYGIHEIAHAVMKVQEIQKQRAESVSLPKNGSLGQRIQLLLETTGKLPAGMIRGVLNAMVVKSPSSASSPKNAVQKTLQARSA